MPPPWAYLATYVPRGGDPEMDARIAEHRARRGGSWQDHEAGAVLPGTLLRVAGVPVLVDCLTLWLAGLMTGGGDPGAETEALVRALAGREAPTVLVANEVGLGIVPETRLGREFRDTAGRLNQRMARLADRVTLMVAGLPMTVK